MKVGYFMGMLEAKNRDLDETKGSICPAVEESFASCLAKLEDC